MPQTEITLPSASRIFYVGAPEFAAHHARALQKFVSQEVLVLAPDEATRVATPGDLCIFYNECQSDIRRAAETLVEKNIPTLLAPDGIIEWRSAWEGGSPAGSMRPIICHKVAALGKAQTRVLASWGNVAKCETTGAPRFDALLNRTPRARKLDAPFRLLVMTAKNPGFTSHQRAVTESSLRDLKTWIELHPQIESTPVEVVWRIAPETAQHLGVENKLRDTTGEELSEVLKTVDAVITTPSTAWLEAALQGVPVALLDFHNVPQYLPGAWTIAAASQFDEVVPQLWNPAPEKLAFQNWVLRDQLECAAPAAPRFARLIEAMLERSRECQTNGEPLSFAPNLLNDNFGHNENGQSDDVLGILRATAQKQERELSALKLELETLQGEFAAQRARLERFENHALIGRVAKLRRVVKSAQKGSGKGAGN